MGTARTRPAAAGGTCGRRASHRHWQPAHGATEKLQLLLPSPFCDTAGSVLLHADGLPVCQQSEEQREERNVPRGAPSTHPCSPFGPHDAAAPPPGCAVPWVPLLASAHSIECLPQGGERVHSGLRAQRAGAPWGRCRPARLLRSPSRAFIASPSSGRLRRAARRAKACRAHTEQRRVLQVLLLVCALAALVGCVRDAVGPSCLRLVLAVPSRKCEPHAAPRTPLKEASTALRPSGQPLATGTSPHSAWRSGGAGLDRRCGSPPRVSGHAWVGHEQEDGGCATESALAQQRESSRTPACTSTARWACSSSGGMRHPAV